MAVLSLESFARCLLVKLVSFATPKRHQSQPINRVSWFIPVHRDLRLTSTELFFFVRASFVVKFRHVSSWSPSFATQPSNTSACVALMLASCWLINVSCFCKLIRKMRFCYCFCFRDLFTFPASWTIHNGAFIRTPPTNTVSWCLLTSRTSWSRCAISDRQKRALASASKWSWRQRFAFYEVVRRHWLLLLARNSCCCPSSSHRHSLWRFAMFQSFEASKQLYVSSAQFDVRTRSVFFPGECVARPSIRPRSFAWRHCTHWPSLSPPLDLHACGAHTFAYLELRELIISARHEVFWAFDWAILCALSSTSLRPSCSNRFHCLPSSNLFGRKRLELTYEHTKRAPM